MTPTLTHLLIVAIALVTVAALWPDHTAGDVDIEPDRNEGGAPQPGAHPTPLADTLTANGARLLAIETVAEVQRLLLDGVHTPPDGVTGQGTVWSVPAEHAVPIGEMLDVPCTLGTTRDGELTVDLAAIPALHIAADHGPVVAWLGEQADRWGWDLAGARQHDGVVTLTRHTSRPDQPLVITATPDALDELPHLPAAARVITDHGDHKELGDGAWMLAPDHTPGESQWLLRPLDLQLDRSPLDTDNGSAIRVDAAIEHADDDHGEPAEVVGVHVLGQVALTGLPPGPRPPKVVEIVAYLAAHPAGATDSELRTNLWATPPSKGRFGNAISDTRRLLGTAPDGQPRLPHQTGGRYHLHPTITSDVARLADPDQPLGVRADALEAIDGRPFTSPTGYQWAHDQGLLDDATLTIRATARRVIVDLLAAGQPDRAARIARRALIAVPLHPALTALHRDARLAGGDHLGARRVESEYRSATGRHLPPPDKTANAHG